MATEKASQTSIAQSPKWWRDEERRQSPGRPFGTSHGWSRSSGNTRCTTRCTPPLKIDLNSVSADFWRSMVNRLNACHLSRPDYLLSCFLWCQISVGFHHCKMCTQKCVHPHTPKHTTKIDMQGVKVWHTDLDILVGITLCLGCIAPGLMHVFSETELLWTTTLKPREHP